MGRKAVVSWLNVLHESDEIEDRRVPYCHSTVEVLLDVMKPHLEFEPIVDGRGAKVSCIGSLYIQDKGVVPGMHLEIINDEEVKEKPFDEIEVLLRREIQILLNGKALTRLVFRETFEEVLLDLASFGKTDPPGAVSATSRTKPAKSSRSRQSSGTYDPALESPSCSSSQSGATESPRQPHVRNPGGGSKRGDTGQFELHPVIDCWPRRLQSDEYLVIFTSRPLGIRVRQDWEEKNAVVWKVTGDFAKRAGVERGSMIYTINEENVSGKKHIEILRLLTSSPLPLRIIFWRTLMIDQPRNYSVNNLDQRALQCLDENTGIHCPPRPSGMSSVCSSPRRIFPMRSQAASPRRRPTTYTFPSPIAVTLHPRPRDTARRCDGQSSSPDGSPTRGRSRTSNNPTPLDSTPRNESSRENLSLIAGAAASTHPSSVTSATAALSSVTGRPSPILRTASNQNNILPACAPGGGRDRRNRS